MKRPTPSRRAVKRAHVLIDLLMKEMHAGLREPERLNAEHWDKLFGAKQSMIANLHKLVATLATLPEMQGNEEGHAAPAAEILSAKEMQLLTAWLAENEA